MARRGIPLCCAISRSTGLPCKNPVLAGTGGLCASHARSTGPKSLAGKLAIQRVLWRHGRRSKAALAEKSASCAVAKALFACLLHEMRGQPAPQKLVESYRAALAKWENATAERKALAARVKEVHR